MAPPGIISPTRVDDLPELGLIEDSTPRDHNNNNNNNGSKSFLSRCCHSYCPCCECSPCCRQEPKKKKPRKGEIGIVVKKKDTGQTLSEMFLTMDRRDYILTHINIKTTPRKMKKRGGRGGLKPVGIRKVNVQPTEIGLELEDTGNLSTTATFGGDDDDDVAKDTTKTTSETTTTTSTETTKGKQGFCAKCVSTLASPFKKTQNEKTSPKIDRGNTQCELCPYDFVPGDDIATSFNKNCLHKFHKECIIEWLLDHDRCPCCDREFLVEREDEPLEIGMGEDDDIFNPSGGRQLSFWTANRPERSSDGNGRADV